MQSCATQAVGGATPLAPICDDVGRSRTDAVLRRTDAEAGGTKPLQISGAYARQIGSSSREDGCGKLLMPRGRILFNCQRQVTTLQAGRTLPTRSSRLNDNAWRSAEVAEGGALIGDLRGRLAGSQPEMMSVVNGAGTRALGGGEQAVGLPPSSALSPPPTALQRRIHCAPLAFCAAVSGHTSARDLLCPSFGRVARRLSPYGGSSTFTRTSFPLNCPSSEIAATLAGSPSTCWSRSWNWHQSRSGARRLMSVGASSSSAAAPPPSPSPSPSSDERRRRRREVELEEEMEDDIFGFLIRVYEKVVAFLSKQGGELRQIEWPSASETFKLTVLTFVVVFLLIIFLSTVDSGLSRALAWLVQRSK